MASAFATTPQGGLAVPTRSTRRAGTLALVAAVLWLTTLAVRWLAGVAEPWGRVTYDALGTASSIWYTIGAAALLGASALTFVVPLGLDRRLGGLGVVGQVGLVFPGLSVVGALAAWVFMGWGLMLTIGTLLVASATLRRDVAPRPPMVAIGEDWRSAGSPGPCSARSRAPSCDGVASGVTPGPPTSSGSPLARRSSPSGCSGSEVGSEARCRSMPPARARPSRHDHQQVGPNRCRRLTASVRWGWSWSS